MVGHERYVGRAAAEMASRAFLTFRAAAGHAGAYCVQLRHARAPKADDPPRRPPRIIRQQRPAGRLCWLPA
ncbi:unnamed protein product, partial [Iphiclides podalirius]